MDLQMTLDGTSLESYRMADWVVGFDICRGEYPDHIKGAYPEDMEGDGKAFLQKEAWEARTEAVNSTEATINRILSEDYGSIQEYRNVLNIDDRL